MSTEGTSLPCWVVDCRWVTHVAWESPNGVNRGNGGLQVAEMTIDLPVETERQLKVAAERRGVAPSAYAAALIQRDLAREWSEEAAQQLLTAGFGWVATLNAGEAFEWERRHQYAEAVAEVLRERWPGLRRGWTNSVEHTGRVELQFTLPPETAPALEELRQCVRERWSSVAGPTATSDVVDVRSWLRQVPVSVDDFLREKHEEVRRGSAEE